MYIAISVRSWEDNIVPWIISRKPELSIGVQLLCQNYTDIHSCTNTQFILSPPPLKCILASIPILFRISCTFPLTKPLLLSKFFFNKRPRTCHCLIWSISLACLFTSQKKKKTCNYPTFVLSPLDISLKIMLSSCSYSIKLHGYIS